MSILLCCDICGKNSGRDKAVFTNGLELVCENYAGTEYNVTLHVGLEDKRDLEFKNKLDNSSDEEIIEMSESEHIIHNPEPHICLACQRELALHLLRDGKANPNNIYKVEQKVKVKPVDHFGNVIEDEFIDDDWDDEDIE